MNSKLGVVGYQIGADTSEIEKCSTLHLRILMVLALADPAPAVCLGIAYCYRYHPRHLTVKGATLQHPP